ncbi:F0F1 ATP synthase subunit B [Fenollaria massiliensis]|uniref:ATP synthase subunit b n=2 Tax=Fenollaria massiliensis TaxID=938288 RepID=A0A9E7DL41_9FIRM|nr:F0F1 ATP synthase subunit B [Fenollaria massiliensis]UQK59867.1 F0F1 ATP synthase subunit B [Fenollaria massiliensis]
MLVQLTATLVLYFILRKFLYFPIKDLLNKRQDYIMKNVEDSEKNNLKSQVALRDYELKLKEAKKEANEIVDQAKKRADDIVNKSVSDAKEESRKIMEKADKELANKKSMAMDEMKGDMVNIAILAAEKLIGENISTKKDKEIIEKSIEEVGKEQWKN